MNTLKGYRTLIFGILTMLLAAVQESTGAAIVDQ